MAGKRQSTANRFAAERKAAPEQKKEAKTASKIDDEPKNQDPEIAEEESSPETPVTSFYDESDAEKIPAALEGLKKGHGRKRIAFTVTIDKDIDERLRRAVARYDLSSLSSLANEALKEYCDRHGLY